jgi:hypothetical protein
LILIFLENKIKKYWETRLWKLLNEIFVGCVVALHVTAVHPMKTSRMCGDCTRTKNKELFHPNDNGKGLFFVVKMVRRKPLRTLRKIEIAAFQDASQSCLAMTD